MTTKRKITLEIKQVRCYGMKSVGILGDSNDPFVLIHLDTYSIKTPTFENGGNDVTWDNINIVLHFEPSKLIKPIEFEVFDENKTLANVLIGAGSLDLASTIPIGSHDRDVFSTEVETKIFDIKSQKPTGICMFLLVWRSSYASVEKELIAQQEIYTQMIAALAEKDSEIIRLKTSAAIVTKRGENNRCPSSELAEAEAKATTDAKATAESQAKAKAEVEVKAKDMSDTSHSLEPIKCTSFFADNIQR